MLSIFKKKKTVESKTPLVVTTDIHSHLLPGLDDGSKSFEESLEMIKTFKALGYKKLITTPHVMGDFYKNTPEMILEKLQELKQVLKNNFIDIEIEAAAEYYLDESLIQKLEKEEKLLTFGDNYLLFETSYLNKPRQLYEAVFMMQSAGYKPVLAHPERYVYLYGNFKDLEEVYERGVLLQVNLNSLNGYYSKPAQDLAEELIKKKMINFIGSDCHKTGHLHNLKKVRNKKIYEKLGSLELYNNTL